MVYRTLKIHILSNSGQVNRGIGVRDAMEANIPGIDYSTNESVPVVYSPCRGVIKPDIVFFGESLPSVSYY